MARRALAAALAAALALVTAAATDSAAAPYGLGTPGPSPPPTAADRPAPPLPPAAKKHRALAAKTAATGLAPAARVAFDRALARRVGKPAEAVITVVNLWTDEVLALPVAGGAPPNPEGLDRFLRCHFTNQPTRMDRRLFDVIGRAARHFRSRRVEIVSGYRAPKYNLMLRKKGREVARDSQHTHGHAVDFRLQGVPVERLRAWAVRLRLGGVGYYPSSRFVHVDVGPVRQWTGD